MTTSPDYQSIVNLTLYDKDPTDIVNVGRTLLQARIPDWSPKATNQEMLVMEAMALEVFETIFSLNRLPESMLRILLQLYGVEMYPGSTPGADFVFTMYDDFGYTIPAETEVALMLPSGEYLSFFTTTDLVIGSGDTSGTVYAMAREYTADANGIPDGTQAAIVTSIVGLSGVAVSGDVNGGANPESTDAWIARGVQVLRRLVSTLVLPEHFTAAALTNGLVYRATTVDNWDSLSGNAPGEDPGEVTVAVMGIGGNLTTEQKNQIRDDLDAQAETNLIVHVVDPAYVSSDVTVSIKVKTGYVDSDVQDRVDLALQEYLSPLSWKFGEPLRPYEIVSLVDQVDGVEYVNTLTEPSGVLDPGDPHTLITAGTITVTVV